MERHDDVGFGAAHRHRPCDRPGGKHVLGHVEPDLDVHSLALLYGESGSAIGIRHTRLVPERQSFSTRTFGIVLQSKLPSIRTLPRSVSPDSNALRSGVVK